MANVYVYSAAAGAGTGADWANAYTTLAAALTAKAAGDVFYVAHDHAETQATAITLTAPGTAASPNVILCVNRAGTVPPVSADIRTTATITTTGNSSITWNSGYFYCYGITCNIGTGAVGPQWAVGGGAGKQIFDTCSFQRPSTNGTGNTIGGFSSTIYDVTFINTTIKAGNVGDTITVTGAVFKWLNTPSAIVGATLPTTLFAGSGRASKVIIDGVDLSALSAKTIFGSSSALGSDFINNCKLPASITIAATPTVPDHDIIRTESDSSGVTYLSDKYNYAGTQTTDTTIIRTGGATDGSQVISQKFVSTANAKWLYPFESLPITLWNTSTSAITTLTIYGTTTGGGVPNNDDIWVEVEYLSSASSPITSLIKTTKADYLAASGTTNNSSDGSTWGGGGAGNGFKMVVPSFTPGIVGPITVRIYVGKASATYYIDPKPEISGVPVSKSYMLPQGAFVNGKAAFYKPVLRRA